jgi:Fe2+ or Zn2+ uptake regulation protein
MPSTAHAIATVTVAPDSQAKTESRFRLRIDGERPRARSVRVFDNDFGRDILHWHGPLADELVRTQALSNEQALSKEDIRRLALAAAVTHRRLGDASSRIVGQRSAALIAVVERAIALGITVEPDYLRVAELLFRYPGQHWLLDDVVALALAEHVAADAGRILNAATRLVETGLVRAIDVDGLRFLDIDTRPHAHVFCEETRQLFDAPEDGVIRVTTRSTPRPAQAVAFFAGTDVSTNARSNT